MPYKKALKHLNTDPVIANLIKNLAPIEHKPEADFYLKGSVTRVGGRMIMIKRQDGFFIVAEELPIQKDSRQGPVENVRSTGWFAFYYEGDIDELGVQSGNKFILIGNAQGTQRVTVGGVARHMPFLVARCVHVWKTGRAAIADFPNLPGGYYPLSQQTYCLPSNSHAKRS